MPIYEYQCTACDHEMEALQKLSDAPLSTCPECNAESLHKKISAAAFRLSGSGWYETDFKSGDKKNLTEKKEDKKDTPAKKEGGEKKPASTPEPSKNKTSSTSDKK